MDDSKAFDVSIDISAPPEVVWGLVSDLSRMGEWSPECTGVKWKGAGGPTVGNRFTGLNQNGKHRWHTGGKIVSARTGEELGWDISFLGFAVSNWTYHLEPTTTGTKVTESWRERRNALLRNPFLGSLVTGVKDRAGSNKQSAEATLQNLKVAAEKAGTAPAG